MDLDTQDAAQDLAHAFNLGSGSSFGNEFRRDAAPMCDRTDLGLFQWSVRAS